MPNYESVDRAFLKALFDSPGAKYEPYGKYICGEDINGCTIWTAVDNSTGDAWTEELGSRMMAVRWLHGYRVRNIYGEVLN